MRRLAFLSILLSGALAAEAEIIDRLAATVGTVAITDSAVRDQIRMAALLNGEPADFSAGNRRKTAQRMVDQELLRLEMGLSRFSMPSQDDVAAQLEKIRQQVFPKPGTLQEVLREYRLSEAELKDFLLLQMATLRFIDFRFRPTVIVSDPEVQAYYEKTFLPDWRRRKTDPPPPLEDCREEIEGILSAARVDDAVSRWLADARAQVRIRYLEEAFR